MFFRNPCFTGLSEVHVCGKVLFFEVPVSAWLTMRMRSARVVSLISMDFMTHSSRIRLASSNTRFIRRSGTIHGTIATTSSGQDA